MLINLSHGVIALLSLGCLVYLLRSPMLKIRFPILFPALFLLGHITIYSLVFLIDRIDLLVDPTLYNLWSLVIRIESIATVVGLVIAIVRPRKGIPPNDLS
jgi:hypothetical protein